MGSYINNRFFSGEIENEVALGILDSLLAFLILFIVSRLLIRFLERLLHSSRVKGKMLNTTLQIIRNAINIIFLIIVLFTVLDLFGINTASLVATAGIGGVAIGFGAQSLVKDVITGFFILLEGQYYIGEDVVIEGISGEVVDFSMRTTKIKDYDTGAIHFIPNGNISIVENRSRVDQLANITLEIPYDHDSEEIIKILEKRFENYENKNIIEGPIVRGISGFKDRFYSILIFIKVKNGNIYNTQREVRKIIADEFREKNINLYNPLLEIKGEK